MRTKTNTFQTGLLRGEERERKEERISEMSILHCEQRHLFMQRSQRLYCCEEAGRGGDLPGEDRGVQVASKSQLVKD